MTSVFKELRCYIKQLRYTGESDRHDHVPSRSLKQEQPGATRGGPIAARSGPGAARSGPGAARSGQEQPGAAMSNQERPGVVWTSKNLEVKNWTM